MVISGCVGPRGDGYRVEDAMTVERAQAYHAKQIDVFGTTAADMVTAITMTYAEEAIGVTKAAQAAGMPVVISFRLDASRCGKVWSNTWRFRWVPLHTKKKLNNSLNF